MACSAMFGHNLEGQFCTNPEWLPFPLTLLAIFVIVVGYAYGSQIWGWAQEKRREGGFFNAIFWLLAVIFAIVTLVIGWTIGFIGAIIIAVAVISFFKR